MSARWGSAMSARWGGRWASRAADLRGFLGGCGPLDWGPCFGGSTWQSNGRWADGAAPSSERRVLAPLGTGTLTFRRVYSNLETLRNLWQTNLGAARVKARWAPPPGLRKVHQPRAHRERHIHRCPSFTRGAGRTLESGWRASRTFAYPASGRDRGSSAKHTL